MKKITSNFFIVALMIVTSVCLISCSSDDKDGDSKSPARAMEGTYTGKLTYWHGGSAIDNVTLKVTATSNSEIKMEFVGSDLPSTAITEVYWVSDDAIWGKHPLFENIICYIGRKSISYMTGASNNESFIFSGTKK